MYVLVATLTSGPLGVRCPHRGTPGGWGWGGGELWWTAGEGVAAAADEMTRGVGSHLSETCVPDHLVDPGTHPPSPPPPPPPCLSTSVINQPQILIEVLIILNMTNPVKHSTLLT